VRAPASVVKKGQPLAEILAPESVAAQEEYLALRNSHWRMNYDRRRASVLFCSAWQHRLA
jgi:hypothetical protein